VTFVREALEPGGRVAAAHPDRPVSRLRYPQVHGSGEGARQAREVLIWAGLVAVGVALTAVAVAVNARVGSPGAPFTGRFRFKVSAGSLLAPATAVTVLAAIRTGILERLRWAALVGASYLAALWWAMSLALVDGGDGFAAPIASSSEYLRDVSAVGSHPGHFLRTFVEQAPHYSVATRTHPPGPVLLLWLLGKLGIHRPETLGVLLTVLACAYVPLLAVAVRSLCHETAARRLMPILVLAPYAVWLAVSMDGIVLLLAAGFVTLGVVGSEPHRSPAWALGAGLVLGFDAMLNYAVAWLGVSVVAVYFVRRRPLLNVFTGAGALVPLLLFWIAGFAWTDGLSAAQADFSVRVGPLRSWLLWAFLDLLLLLIACGPPIIRALKRLHLTPGWPFVVGAGLAVIFAILSGLSRGEVERSWLAFYPFLLIPAIAPALRPPKQGGIDAGPILFWPVAIGAVGAIVIEAVLRTTW
jgi:methylthioxylose transferase